MAKTFALVFGVVFVLVGVLGFVPNSLVGADGFFQTNLLHDLVHLLFGAILLLVAFLAPMKSGVWLKLLGLVYLLLAVLGFVLLPAGGTLLGLVQMNMNDHWLHVALGVVLLAVGFSVGKKQAPTAVASM